MNKNVFSRRKKILVASVACGFAFMFYRHHSTVNVHFGVETVRALPQYAAREGRACDTCHTDPTGWENPSLADRKCNLSCITCHVNPTGGGLRTVSGRFYGQATLPIVFASHRPYEDWNRHLVRFLDVPKDRGNRLGDAGYGKPIGGSAPLALSNARYAGLNADPFLLWGIDTRYAFWYIWPQNSRLKFFPMQLDTHLALHPYRHVTAYVTAGVLAKAKGLESTFDRPTPFMVKDTFLMVHQLPYSMYFRLGRFIPAFGTYIDDHTSPIRRDFELDHGLEHSRVTGIEFGMAPNYPFLHVSLFRPNQKEQFVGDDPENDDLPPFAGVDGWGAAIALGWRDLAWHVGISGLIRQRDLSDGGNTESVSLSWVFNPWYFWEWFPVTYLGEVAFGGKRRPISGSTTGHLASFHELNALIFNGVNLKLKYDYSDGDTAVRADHYHRMSIGADLVLFPAFSFSGLYRIRSNVGVNAKATSDAVLMLRGWY